jgi:hypothetical protein
MDAPDIIYVVRSGEINNELRYSLRSLGHLPHGRVFITGHCPSWVRNVTHIPVPRMINKFDSIERNLRAALAHPELGEHAYYFNDDFYVTEPIDEIPVMHRGIVDLRVYAQEFRIRMITTLNALGKGVVHLDYELHVPLPLAIEQARDLMAVSPTKVMWRTWYGNMARLGGEMALDVKSRHGEVHNSALLSSSPRAFNTIRRYLDDLLPRSMYE